MEIRPINIGKTALVKARPAYHFTKSKYRLFVRLFDLDPPQDKTLPVANRTAIGLKKSQPEQIVVKTNRLLNGLEYYETAEEHPALKMAKNLPKKLIDFSRQQNDLVMVVCGNLKKLAKTITEQTQIHSFLVNAQETGLKYLKVDDFVFLLDENIDKILGEEIRGGNQDPKNGFINLPVIYKGKLMRANINYERRNLTDVVVRHLFTPISSFFPTRKVAEPSHIPVIESYSPGSMVIDNQEYSQDVLVSAKGVSKWTRQRASQVGPMDIDLLAPQGTKVIIFGTGAHESGKMIITRTVRKLLKKRKIKVIVGKTAEALKEFNKRSKKKGVVGAFRVVPSRALPDVPPVLREKTTP